MGDCIMRVALILAVFAVSLGDVAFAQEWTEFISREDGFRVDFPEQPKITQTTYKSEYGADLPARVYTVERGGQRYSVTAVDYGQAQRILTEKAKACPPWADERCTGVEVVGAGYWKMEIAGALLHATYQMLQRDARLTHMSWNFVDLVEAHLIQLTNNADQSRTFACISMHEDKLYIIEGTVPKGYPEPGLFQQSMGYVDKDGNGIRYRSTYSNIFPAPARARGGPGGAASPGAPPKANAPGTTR
jgi:hypothetical protein